VGSAGLNPTVLKRPDKTGNSRFGELLASTGSVVNTYAIAGVSLSAGRVLPSAALPRCRSTAPPIQIASEFLASRFQSLLAVLVFNSDIKGDRLGPVTLVTFSQRKMGYVRYRIERHIRATVIPIQNRSKDGWSSSAKEFQ
jgi:hypothetical protein